MRILTETMASPFFSRKERKKAAIFLPPQAVQSFLQAIIGRRYTVP